MNPYCVEVEKAVVDLYLLSDGRFQLIKQGEIGPLMVGYDYVLVENKLYDYLQNLDIERVTFEDATIWDRKADIEHKNYKRMIVNQHFNSDQINDIDLDGKRFLVMDKRYLFASPDLKQELEKSEFDFRFSEGLSEFG